MFESTVEAMKQLLKQHVYHNVKSQIETEFENRTKIAVNIFQRFETIFHGEYSDVTDICYQWYLISAELAQALQNVNDEEIIIETGYGFVWGSPEEKLFNPTILMALAELQQAYI